MVSYIICLAWCHTGQTVGDWVGGALHPLAMHSLLECCKHCLALDNYHLFADHNTSVNCRAHANCHASADLHTVIYHRAPVHGLVSPDGSKSAGSSTSARSSCHVLQWFCIPYSSWGPTSLTCDECGGGIFHSSTCRPLPER